ncbi:mersacidin/lichenicidin family type 2 lantibiotic [Bacillus cereus]|uniref:mersacidin/lichenicidin family type 2 lantibiotic n=1 Tax=Bacillus cereus TaxID=1396 RepID=UPI001BAD7A90
MTNEEIIVAWKNPKVRGKNMPSHPSGVGFQELSINEMAQVTGGAVEQRATPTLATPLTPHTPYKNYQLMKWRK